MGKHQADELGLFFILPHQWFWEWKRRSIKSNVKNDYYHFLDSFPPHLPQLHFFHQGPVHSILLLCCCPRDTEAGWRGCLWKFGPCYRRTSKVFWGVKFHFSLTYPFQFCISLEVSLIYLLWQQLFYISLSKTTQREHVKKCSKVLYLTSMCLPWFSSFTWMLW